MGVQRIIEFDPLGMNLRPSSCWLTDAVSVMAQNVVNLENASPRRPELLVDARGVIAVVDQDLVPDTEIPLPREFVVLSLSHDLGLQVILVYDVMRK